MCNHNHPPGRDTSRSITYNVVVQTHIGATFKAWVKDVTK